MYKRDRKRIASETRRKSRECSPRSARRRVLQEEDVVNRRKEHC